MVKGVCTGKDFIDKPPEQWYVALTNLDLDQLYGDACTGFCLYEFTENNERVRVLSSTIDAQGVIKLYNREA
jgi:hypothetical protein